MFVLMVFETHQRLVKIKYENVSLIVYNKFNYVHDGCFYV